MKKKYSFHEGHAKNLFCEVKYKKKVANSLTSHKILRTFHLGKPMVNLNLFPTKRQEKWVKSIISCLRERQMGKVFHFLIEISGNLLVSLPVSHGK